MNCSKSLLISLFFLVISCSKRDSGYKICNVNNPLENIAWLRDIKMDFEANPSLSQQQIIYYKYKEKDVFKIIGLKQSTDHPVLVYDCQKNIICSFGGILNNYPCPDFATNITNQTILFEN